MRRRSTAPAVHGSTRGPRRRRRAGGAAASVLEAATLPVVAVGVAEGVLCAARGPTAVTVTARMRKTQGEQRVRSRPCRVGSTDKKRRHTDSDTHTEDKGQRSCMRVCDRVSECVKQVGPDDNQGSRFTQSPTTHPSRRSPRGGDRPRDRERRRPGHGEAKARQRRVRSATRTINAKNAPGHAPSGTGLVARRRATNLTFTFSTLPSSCACEHSRQWRQCSPSHTRTS